jgi:hypothetical protein
LEYGKSGVPLGADQIKALESTSAVQLNGLKTKLESAILSGEIEGDLFEGLKISIEANALKAGVDSDGEAEVDLMTITVKLVGDAGHLLNAGPNVTLTIDGNLSIALGGKLAAQLSSFTVAQLEQQMIAKEMSELGDHLDDNVRKMKDLEAQADLLESQGSSKQASKLREEAFQHKLKVSTANQQLERHTGKLKAAKARAEKAIGKLQSKVAKQVAKAMEKKAIKFIATKLMKLVPILNLVSTVMDVIELVGIIKNLLERDFDGNGGETGDTKEGNSAGSGTRKDDTTTGSESAQEDTTGAAETTSAGGASSTKETDIAEARSSLPPAARAVVDALTTRGRAGAVLDRDQIKMIGLLVQNDLTADELAELLATLRESGTKARTAEELIEAVSTAVRSIRNRASTVKVNGETRNDLSAGTPGAERVDESHRESGGGNGPVTSPGQVEGATRAIEVVRGGDAAVIGHWFKAAGEELVWTQAGEAWRGEHVGAEVAPGTELFAADVNITNSGPGQWRLEIRFQLLSGETEHPITHRFSVYVGGEDNGMGAKVGDLKFEGYVVIGSE